ncbi:MAG: hypothetical protein LBE62_05475 [Azonexus sp.]|jgi:hypothetical protein|nr:hypothetical protein [Azonexus sp.]
MPEEDAVAPLTTEQIAAFWRAFSSRLPALEALDSYAFVEQASDLLQDYEPGLAIELEGEPKTADARLVLTAHGVIAHFENLQALARHAPPCEPYTVQAFRSRTLGSGFAMRMQDFDLSCDDVLVGHYDAGGNVGLELSFAKEIPQDMMDHARHMAFIMLDHVLGEWDFAVRVGPVDFVDTLSEAQPLSQFVPIFDAFQRDALGRSYVYPQEENDRWSSLEARPNDADEDDPPDILTFHDSANALATRADLSHFLAWRFPIGSQEELDNARAAQDALEAQLLRQQSGIMAFSRIEGMSSRLAAFYVTDPVAATELAGRLAAEHAPAQEADLHVIYDPAWREYLELYAAIYGNE